MARPIIEGIEWDDESVAHVLRHDDPVAPETIDAMIEGNDWFAFPNKQRHPSERRLVIGRTPSGDLVTVVLEPAARRPGYWRPVTGWWSTRTESDRYARARQRDG